MIYYDHLKGESVDTSSSALSTVTLDLPLGKSISIVDTPTDGLSYQRVGNGATNRRSNMASIDLLTVMEDMTTYEIRALNKVRTNVSWEFDPETGEQYTLGIAYIPTTTFATKAEQLSFQKGIKLLKDKGLIKKAGRNNYMLNPRAILPTRVKTAMLEFDKLK